MEPVQIVTVSQFRQFIIDLAETTGMAYEGSLEDYLHALWRLVQEHQNDQVSYALLAELLQQAFQVTLAPFDESWLDYRAPPDLTMNDPTLIEDQFGYLRHMLLYQIADLHRMEQAGTINEPHRYLGIDSPTGYRWYNFHPADYLSCAAQTLDEKSTSTECSWVHLTITLWVGQIYE